MTLLDDYQNYQALARLAFIKGDDKEAMTWSYLANKAKFDMMENAVQSLDEAFETYKKKIKGSE